MSRLGSAAAASSRASACRAADRTTRALGLCLLSRNFLHERSAIRVRIKLSGYAWGFNEPQITSELREGRPQSPVWVCGSWPPPASARGRLREQSSGGQTFKLFPFFSGGFDLELATWPRPASSGFVWRLRARVAFCRAPGRPGARCFRGSPPGGLACLCMLWLSFASRI